MRQTSFPTFFLGSLTPSKVLDGTGSGIVRNLAFKNMRPKYRSGGRVDSRDWFSLNPYVQFSKDNKISTGLGVRSYHATEKPKGPSRYG